MYTKNTKVVCTLGPSSDSVSEIVALINAGMNVARLNFSHGTYSHHKKIINNVHKAEKLTGKTIGILQDLQGPKIRIGEMPEEGILVKKGEKFLLTSQKVKGQVQQRLYPTKIIPITYNSLTKDIKKEHKILIDDGLIEVTAIKKNPKGIICKVKFGGLIKTRKGVNFPDSNVSVQTITEKDKQDLKFGLKNKVDFVALSFVKSKKDLQDLRKLIKNNTPIIAKVERHEAVKNLKEIIKTADGVMVARGDLGSDLQPEQVPIVQKRMIALANKYGKPVILATQVLQSMVENSSPTRAEISDAANAVYDHTDAIMLSNESAVGKYPAKAARTLTKVASAVEKELQQHKELLQEIVTPRKMSAINAACLNAAEIAQQSNADAIVVYTSDGYTAKNIAKHRLYTPIITVTPNKKTARELTLVWGINKVLIKKATEKTIINLLKKEKLVRKGDNLVMIFNASKKQSTISTTKI
ncbi:MAG: pyruvate kinase [Nitrospirota bacterium]